MCIGVMYMRLRVMHMCLGVMYMCLAVMYMCLGVMYMCLVGIIFSFFLLFFDCILELFPQCDICFFHFMIVIVM